MLNQISTELIKEASMYTYVRAGLFNMLDPPKQNIVILRGARGIGKSTLLLQYLSEQQYRGHKVLYVSADSAIIPDTLAKLAYDFYFSGGEYLAIDEIHKYIGWQPEAKTIIDSFPKLKVLVSGSSSLNLDYAAADLSRRHIMLQAKGLSFREFLNKNYLTQFRAYDLVEILTNAEDLAVDIMQQLRIHKIDLIELFHLYLQEGYFITRDKYKSEGIYYSSLINTINSVIDSDLPSVYHDLDNLSIQKIKLLLKHVAQKCPFTPNIKELSSHLGIAKDNTLKKYLQYLHDGEVLLNLYPVNKSHKDFLKPQKIFLNNSNYAYAFGNNPEIGTIRETFVANCLNGLGDLTAPTYGDFCLDNNWTFEVGGKTKTKKQIKDINNSYVLADDILWANKDIIPLWLLGFLW